MVAYGISSFPVDFINVLRFSLLNGSAKNGDNVEEAFLRCSKSILAKIETGELDPERTGSGIQYGDAALRNIQLKQRNPSRSNPSDCRCGL